MRINIISAVFFFGDTVQGNERTDNGLILDDEEGY
jgi:hypothetical protein